MFKPGDLVKLKQDDKDYLSDLKGDYLSDLNEGDITSEEYDMFQLVLSGKAFCLVEEVIGEEYNLSIDGFDIRYLIPEERLTQ